VAGVAGAPSKQYPNVDLKQAIAIAVAGSPVLASARADAALAAVQVRLAQANALPNLSVSGTTARFRGSTRSSGGATGGGTATPSPAGGGSIAVTSNSLSVGVRQLLFDGFHTEAQIHAADAAAVAAADTYRSSLDQLGLNVAKAYYTALSAERQTGAALASLKNAQTQRDLVAAQVAVGTAARSNISNAELQVAQARLLVIQDQASALNALAAFSTTLGVSANEVVQPVDDVPTNDPGTMTSLPVPSYQEALQRALALRPDYAAATEQVVAAERSVRAARAARWPSLVGTASSGTSSTDLVGGGFQPAWSIGAQLTLPIYDGGLIAATVSQAQETELKAQATARQAQLVLQSDVKQALVSLASAKAALVAANQERATADEQLRATEAQYKAGVTTLPLLLQAQTGYTSALVDQVNAAYGVRQAEQQYLFAIGDNIKM
ncbi:MAG: TolC family protein, partial [bacterium]|nr:TolC family protein [bacterium]